MGMTLSPDSSGKMGWRTVLTIAPGDAADKAGVRPGDSIRFENFLGSRWAWQPGERANVTLERGGRRIDATLIAQPLRTPPHLAGGLWLAGAILGLMTVGFSLLLLIRGWSNRAAIMLSLFAMMMDNNLVMAWLPAWLVDLAVLTVYLLAVPFIGLGFLIFVLDLSGGPASRRQEGLVYALGVAFMVVFFLIEIVQTLYLPSLVPLNWLTTIAPLAHQLCGLTILAWNYRRNDATARNRIKIAGSAYPLLALTTVIAALCQVLGAKPLVGQWVNLLGIFGSLGLLSYAVLKQRLFDFGFAINRTLVYGGVSFTLLAAFGLAEWGADHLVPEAWHRESALYSAGIALILFLSFHRLRDWFEHHIERLFFHDWQRSEASLKRFVGSAGHFEQPPALCRGFHDALLAFTRGTAASIYLRGADGTYVAQAGEIGDAPMVFEADDPAFALMRSERKPVILSGGGARLPGALALPMLDQDSLLGFVLVGNKADGALYRPDEIENLGWAALQVGLDIQALKARRLETEVAGLKASLDWSLKSREQLAQERDRLAGLLEQLSPQS